MNDYIAEYQIIKGFSRDDYLVKYKIYFKILVPFLVPFLFRPLYAQKTARLEELMKKEFEKRDSIHRSKYGTDYPAFTVITLNGDTITEKQLTGKVTLINFWFEQCAPCVAEIPALNELYLKYKNHPEFQLFRFVCENPERAAKCVRKFNISYSVCSDSDKESFRLNINTGFPTKYYHRYTRQNNTDQE